MFGTHGNHRSSNMSQITTFTDTMLPSLMTIPKELRLHILDYLFNTKVWRYNTKGWFLQPILKVCRQIRGEAISTFFGTRDLIFDLPDFIPHKLRNEEWPSAIDVHDQHDSLSIRFAPTFLRDSSLSTNERKYTWIERLKACPFHLFRRICIKIPPPDPDDPAQLIMNWSRLRSIARVLGAAKAGLPSVQVIFLETPARSWLSSGKLTLSSSKFQPLQFEGDNEISDLIILLRALAPLRSARDITIQTPPLFLSEPHESHPYALDWLKKSATKTRKWGEYMDLDWDDMKSIWWLDHCELILHQLLHELDTPIAPFLRLEQFASLTHFEHTRLCTHSYGAHLHSSVCAQAEKFMDALLRCAIVFSPTRRPVNCMCDIDPWISCFEICPSRCPESGGFKGWLSRRKQWSKSFDKKLSKLQKAAGLRRDDQDQAPAGEENLRPTQTRNKAPNAINDRPSLAGLLWVGRQSTACTCFWPGDKWHFRYPKDASGSEDEVGGTYYKVGRTWIKAYPRGIAHDRETVGRIKSESQCRTLRNLPEREDMYFYLQRRPQQ